MENFVYNFKLRLDWELLELINQIERFDTSWLTLEKKEEPRLNVLRTLATISSVGASTRIEGSQLNDQEVEELLNNIDVTKTEDRDAQEVVGYFNVLDLITASYQDIGINENDIKNLHNILLKISDKDQWHKGDYKQLANAVEAKFPDGSKQIIFRTTEPGIETKEAMKGIVNWYNKEDKVHPLVKVGAFVYDLLSIHPFQDGNGRLSRLLTTLLMLKSGFRWIQYVSLEHEIEINKKAYYKALRNCQAQRPNEDITEWIKYFLSAMVNVQKKLSIKLERTGIESNLSAKEKLIFGFINDYANCRSGVISNKLNIPSPTVKRILTKLVKKELIVKQGSGAGTTYIVK